MQLVREVADRVVQEGARNLDDRPFVRQHRTLFQVTHSVQQELKSDVVRQHRSTSV